MAKAHAHVLGRVVNLIPHLRCRLHTAETHGRVSASMTNSKLKFKIQGTHSQITQLLGKLCVTHGLDTHPCV